ncbi:MAG TPA: OmpA family protein, partial [Devosia sp.]|nr:OmpA family protein [Devosia sp.]
AVDFGLALLQRLNEGRFALRGNIVTMTGIARSSADYAALAALIATGAPQGLVLAKSEISAPAAAPYLWSATKSSDGAIALSGMVPDLAAKATLAGAKGHPAVAALSYASGEPGGFLASATTALDLLQFLDIGSASYDGTGWAIAGEAASASEKAAIEASFATYKLAAAGWAFDVSVVAAPAPMAPYTWSATRSADGAIALAGHVPTQGMKNFLAIYAGNAITDTTAVTDGAPEGFVGQVRAALDAVLALDSGAAQFDGNTWTLSGQAASAAVRDSVLTGLGTFAKDWTVAIATPAVVEPAAVPDVQPEAPDTIEPAVPEKPAVTAPTVDPAYRFSATRGAGRAVTMSGNLPAEPALRFFGVITGAPTTGVTIAAGAPDGFVLSAETGIRGLMVLQAGELAFANGKLSLSGTAATDADRDALTASIAALSSGAAWTVAIATPPPLMACQTKVVEFSAANAILFQSGAAIIATESQPALDALAGYLALCPNADVDIEGHTDADGDDQLNLALSVARAEAVIAALVSRHVAASRLYAVGYGESQPIADNTTAAGKRLNRRIVVKVQEHHQD